MQYQNEIYYQDAIWYYLIKKKKFENSRSETITIINNGKLNPYEGPDLKNVCFQFKNELIIGDSEIDIKSSNWYSHKHYRNKQFQNVKLHLVFENNKNTGLNTVIIDPDTLPSLEKNSFELLSPLELEQHAAQRLARKANELKLYKVNGIRYLWTISLKLFIESISRKRKRPSALSSLEKFFSNRYRSDLYLFVSNHYYNDHRISSESIFHLFKESSTPFSKEIFINCFLPSLLAVSEANSDIIFIVWWSLEAPNNYAYLKKRFPQFSQKYVWQQQGMIEFLRSCNESKNLIK